MLKKIVAIALALSYSSPCVLCPRCEETPIARMLVLDGDECLWNVLEEVLEREGYTVFKADNDYEGLPHALPRLMALALCTIQHDVALDCGGL